VPETTFAVRWPDGTRASYYSPSLVVEEHLEPGAGYPVGEFVERTRTALGIASERVRARYGFPCARAAASQAGIERAAAAYGDGTVVVEGFGR
jgi:uncharacterized repeat protein (TIGR04042 family)